MKTTTNLIASTSLPLLLIAALMMSCGDAGDTYDTASSPSPASGRSVSQNSNDAMNSANASGTMDASATADRYDATGRPDANGNYNADGTLRTGVVLTPAQERSDAMAGMNGIRATLMAELDQVRTELNDGTLDKDQTAVDKERAADLAQGLERIDRALAAMGGATDVTWNEMRTAQLKEASDVRVWWNDHMAKREAMARK